jgi:hypothetical protein
VGDLEIGKLLEVAQFKISDAPCSSANCLIEGYDSFMDAGMCDGEKIDDVFTVTGEFS